MKYLTYQPSVEAYIVHVGKDGAESHYDVSPDIVACRVTRNEDAPSTFSMTVRNKKNKYSGRFLPMDKITIYATKTRRIRLFTGYVTSAPQYTLFEEDMELSGSCVLYLLQVFYWDASLVSSNALLYNQYGVGDYTGEVDSGYWRVGSGLLTQVAGWNKDRIKVGSIPTEVVLWASEMYKAKLEDTSGVDIVNDFMSMLQSCKSTINIGGATASGGVSNSTEKPTVMSGTMSKMDSDGWTYNEISNYDEDSKCGDGTVIVNAYSQILGACDGLEMEKYYHPRMPNRNGGNPLHIIMYYPDTKMSVSVPIRDVGGWRGYTNAKYLGKNADRQWDVSPAVFTAMGTSAAELGCMNVYWKIDESTRDAG